MLTQLQPSGVVCHDQNFKYSAFEQILHQVAESYRPIRYVCELFKLVVLTFTSQNIFKAENLSRESKPEKSQHVVLTASFFCELLKSVAFVMQILAKIGFLTYRPSGSKTETHRAINPHD